LELTQVDTSGRHVDRWVINMKELWYVG
jgi:hypothetical protein